MRASVLRVSEKYYGLHRSSCFFVGKFFYFELTKKKVIFSFDLDSVTSVSLVFSFTIVANILIFSISQSTQIQ